MSHVIRIYQIERETSCICNYRLVWSGISGCRVKASQLHQYIHSYTLHYGPNIYIYIYLHFLQQPLIDLCWCISACIINLLVYSYGAFDIDLKNQKKKFYCSTYFCYYLQVLLYFLILFMGINVLFQLLFNFIYNTFNKKFIILIK